MKSILYALFLFTLPSLFGQKADSYSSSIKLERKNHISEMTSIEKGILNEEEISNYISHNYFPIDEKYCKKYKVYSCPKETITMQTSANKEKEYNVVGWVKIIGPNREIDTLYILQSVVQIQSEEIKNYFFIPFKDKTSGNETYGAGRYLDVTIHNGKTTIDFNKAYNPYCAFSNRYNCPIPPKRNNLHFSVFSGEKTPSLRDD